jgi:shikimate dehydrogenase
MPSTERILPGDFALGADFGPHLAAAFTDAEIPAAFRLSAPVHVGGLGTVAHRVISSPAFAAVMDDIAFEVVGPYASPESLLSDEGWEMALVFSPHKQTLAELLPSLAPTAGATRTVDTIVRSGVVLTGFNTNSWAAQAVLESLCGDRIPERTLVLGAGPSARSVVVAARRAWGDGADVAVTARDATSLGAVADARPVSAQAASSERPSLLINCTTWGETAESEETPFGLPFDALLRPGLMFLDLNNRVSKLQEAALAKGAYVTSGIAVRDANNVCRAALVAGAKEA